MELTDAGVVVLDFVVSHMWDIAFSFVFVVLGAVLQQTGERLTQRRK